MLRLTERAVPPVGRNVVTSLARTAPRALAFLPTPVSLQVIRTVPALFAVIVAARQAILVPLAVAVRAVCRVPSWLTRPGPGTRTKVVMCPPATRGN